MFLSLIVVLCALCCCVVSCCVVQTDLSFLNFLKFIFVIHIPQLKKRKSTSESKKKRFCFEGILYFPMTRILFLFSYSISNANRLTPSCKNFRFLVFFFFFFILKSGRRRHGGGNRKRYQGILYGSTLLSHLGFLFFL